MDIITIDNYKDKINYEHDKDHIINNNIKYRTSNIIDEDKLNEYIEYILNNNKNAKFYDILYEKDNQTVYFYTDMYINTNYSFTNENNEMNQFETQIKEVLVSTYKEDDEVSSLYDVYSLLQTYTKEYHLKLKEDYDEIEDFIKYSVKGEEEAYIINYRDVLFENHISENGRLILNLRYFESTSDKIFCNDKVIFLKKDGDIFLEKIDSTFELKNLKRDLLYYIYKNLYDIYETQKNYSFLDFYICNIKPVNIDLSVCIGDNILITKNINQRDVLNIIFNLSVAYEDFDNFSNSGNILNLTIGKELDLVKKIYIKNSDLPKWMQEELKKLKLKKIYEQSLVDNGSENKETIENQSQSNLKFLKKIKKKFM